MSNDHALTRRVGRPVTSFEDRLKRAKVVQIAQQYAEEVIELYVNAMRNQDHNIETRLGAGKWLWEAGYGKPAQAVTLEEPGVVKHVHIVKWLPPDPADTSVFIEPEKD